MRFAILGNHPDGLEVTRALAETSRHQLVAYTSPLPPDLLARCDGAALRFNDLEEVLADPRVDAVVVASSPDVRPAHLRRALQSERHVLCVYPPDQSPETAYEAALIQQDVGTVLLPLLTEALHPAFEHLAGATGPVGTPILVDLEIAAAGFVLVNAEAVGLKPSFPGWAILRRLGGEIAEVTAFAASQELPCDQPILVAGRFERGGLFRLTLLPDQPSASTRVTLLDSNGRAILTFGASWQDDALLTWERWAGQRQQETFPPWGPWPAVVGHFEALVNASQAIPGAGAQSAARPADHWPLALGHCSWQDAIRCLELDDAARRSLQRRHSQMLEYPEASEEVGFKGAMTLVGCATLWGVVLLLIVSRWLPWIGWLIVPILAGFLLLQLFRYVLPPSRRDS